MRNFTVKYNINLLLFLMFFGLFNSTKAQQAWINEIHYNNVSDDVDEFVEVALAQGFSNDLSTLTVELYNGGDGQLYASYALNTFTKGASYNGFVFYYRNITNIQNTHPSGLALVLNGVAIQFISYGGTFNAVNGSAAGYTSQNMGVTENNATALGFSLQLGGGGTHYTDFSWNAPANDTPGELNVSQTFPAAMLQAILSDTATHHPSKPLDTISYKLEIKNIGDGDANNVIINRKGDTNTTFLPGTFQSSVLALPADVETGLEDQIATLLLKGLDPDGDTLTFSIVQQPQQGNLNGLVSVNKSEAFINYQPNAGFTGSDSFIFAVSDDDNNHDTSTVSIAVRSVNDAPNFTPGKDIVILEDAGQQIINNWATSLSKGAADEANQSLEFIIINNNNPGLFTELPQIAPDGTLAFTTSNNANGTANIIIQLKDDGGTANGGVDTSARDTLIITVNSVNDAPSFTKGDDITLKTTTTLQTFDTWAKEIIAGPLDETAQIVTFVIENNDNAMLFSEVPQITSTGTLIFRPAEGAVGVANITIKIMDDGGTANGGVDTSVTQTLKITLEPAE